MKKYLIPMGPSGISLILVLTLAGCSSFSKRMNSRIGKMEYEEALMELGPADKKEETDRAKVFLWSRGPEHLVLSFDKQTGKMVHWRRMREAPRRNINLNIDDDISPKQYVPYQQPDISRAPWSH